MQRVAGRVAGLPEPGQRMPGVEVDGLGGPGTLYAALRSGRHVLIGGLGTETGVARGPYRELVDVCSARTAMRGGTALVRPDGYVAAVGTAGDMASIFGYGRDRPNRAGMSAAWMNGIGVGHTSQHLPCRIHRLVEVPRLAGRDGAVEFDVTQALPGVDQQTLASGQPGRPQAGINSLHRCVGG